MTAISLKQVSKHFILKEDRHVPLYQDIINILLKGKRRKVIKALTGINLEIQKGEKIGVIGANGSGKTTLLRIISGIYAPSEGECAVEGVVTPFLQSGLGIAPTLSVIDNIKLYGGMIGLSASQINRSVDAIFDFSELKEFRYAPLQLLSSGMQQRLFFSILAQTMHYRSSNIYIFDESLNSGDKNFSEKCKSFLHQLRNSPKTILFSSHSIDQIQTICGKTIYLQEGRIKQFDTTERVIKEYLAK